MSIYTIPVFLCLVHLLLCTESYSDQNGGVANFHASSFPSPLLIKKDQRNQIVATEFGEISAVQIGDEHRLQFITLEPHAFLLPILLHSDMVLFVHTGRGILYWVEKEKERTLKLRRGDVFRLRSGTVFYMYSYLERDGIPEKLRVYAIFDAEECLYEPCLGPYSSIRDVLMGFNERTLRTAFAVPKELSRKLRDAPKPPLITNAFPRNIIQGLEEETWQSRLVKLFVRPDDVIDHLAMKPVGNSKKKKKSSAYNVFKADPDFENVNGRSIVVDEKDIDALKGSSVGVYMVNLTKGAIMAPHWNPSAAEISIVLQGRGMIRVVNHLSPPSSKSNKNSDSERFLVEEGDVFIVPQFFPMSQMSFDNSSFLFMGYSTSAKTNYPQFLVGQSSVLKVLDQEVLATSFNMRNDTIERLLEAQKESVMLECVACAEVELIRLMREVEEKRRREEEEIERRRKEEEEATKKEEEISRKREEEKRREEEEAERKRKKEEQAEAKKREEERKRRKEEEEEVRKRKEEREREEEKAKRQEEERKRREKEEEEVRKREEEREREAEKARRQEEERRRQEEEKEAARRREEKREKEEEMAKKREEERQRKEREEVERKRREEEARKREEEREKEQEMAKKREEERQRKEREEVKRKRQEEAMKRAKERKREEEAAKTAEEERRRREREEEKRRWPPQPQGKEIMQRAF